MLVATGSEVQVATAARKLLEPGAVRAGGVDAVPRVLRGAAGRRSATPSCRRARRSRSIEAGIQQGWGDVIRQPMLFLGMNRFGASAPNEALAEHFGFTGEKVAARVRAWLGGAA